MPAYQSTGGDIGTLLRLIQEDKSSTILANPAADVASPIRGVVQGPLKSPESPGTTRVASLRPEGSALGVSGPEQGVVTPAGAAPVPGGVVAPVAPRPTPVPTPTPPSASPSSPAPSMNRPSNMASAPSLGTKITSMPTIMQKAMQVIQKSVQKTPTRSTYGAPIVNVNTKKVPIPTPTPVPKNAPRGTRSNYIGYTA